MKKNRYYKRCTFLIVNIGKVITVYLVRQSVFNTAKSVKTNIGAKKCTSPMKEGHIFLFSKSWGRVTVPKCLPYLAAQVYQIVGKTLKNPLNNIRYRSYFKRQIFVLLFCFWLLATWVIIVIDIPSRVFDPKRRDSNKISFPHSSRAPNPPYSGSVCPY